MAITPASGTIIHRQTVVGSEGLWTKMFDPPKDSPLTAENLDLTLIGLDGNPTTPAGTHVRANPVVPVMQAAGYMKAPTKGGPYTVTRTLLHGVNIPTWDVRPGGMMFFLFADDDLLPGTFAGGVFPAPTYRAPRGAICHNFTQAASPPHTIHWHGIEPTPLNDGVGHCSMELGKYTYQWQPNFIGTYFYHCHRNTMQHFEFGLAGIMPFHPPDAWFASIATVVNPATGQVTLIPGYPIGHGRPEPGFDTGRFRTAANLDFPGIPTFPGFYKVDTTGATTPNPAQGVANPDPWTGAAFLKFPTDPHAYTVPYDVEALWVVDDRDSVWSDNMMNFKATFPGAAITPPNEWVAPVGFDGRAVTGVNDEFNLNPGTAGFFNFNDFNADYWYITGVPVPAPKGGTGTINPTGPAPTGGGLPPDPSRGGVGVIPPQLNSGVSGTQISINARVNETVFVRNLCAAYNSCRTTFPFPVVIIEWDGRALGVPPLNQYTRPILVPANTPIVHSTARRWGAIFNLGAVGLGSGNYTATVEFLDTRSTVQLNLGSGGDPPLMTALIPITIVP